MSSNHEDWWYTEKLSLTNKEWDTYTIHIPSLSAFDWYSNTDTQCRMDGLTRICFAISPSVPMAGSFWLDDIKLEGEISPAKDFKQTVIVRREDRFAQSHTDGVEVYRGAAESCMDATALVDQIYYYAAFSADDRDNWSVPAPSAQWLQDPSTNLFSTIVPDAEQVKKIWKNQQLYILRGDKCYTILGQYCQ